MPLDAAPWGDTSASSTDRFGVTWMVNITVPADVPAETVDTSVSA